MKRLTVLALLLAQILLAGCAGTGNVRIDSDSVKSYKDIPGITEEEINAIEALKEKNASFSYAHLLETESFLLPDGRFAGFTIKLCERLSEMFGIEFVPRYCGEFETLKSEIDSGALDFTGVFTETSDRLKRYYMSVPIAGRSLMLYTLDSAGEIVNENDINGLRIGFPEGTIIRDAVSEAYPELSFDTIEVRSLGEAAGMLETGEIDAFVVDSTAEPAMAEHELLRPQKFFQGVYTPVSMATSRHELKPIISVIDKYIGSGGYNEVFELYKQGETEYIKNKLFKSFTDEEKAYIEGLYAKGGNVGVGIQHDAYPISFYNAKDKRFEGIAVDILEEVAALTDINFKTGTTAEYAPLSEILDNLKSGGISMMPLLLQTASREEDYIWSTVPYHTSKYAMLSKSSLPNLAAYQVYFVNVGTLNQSAYEEMFNIWFPGHEKQYVYNTSDEGFDALEKGEIDLLMLSENMLLALTNYREEPGYKINISFDQTMDSLFGYNKNEAVLCSIIDKALKYIDTDRVSASWLHRSFDYSIRISRIESLYILVFIGAVLLALFALFFLFIKTERLGASLMEQTATLSTMFASIPDIVFCMDKKLIYTSCNPSFEKFADLPKEKIIGRSDDEIFGTDKEMVNYFTLINERVIKTRNTEIINEWVVYPDGNERFLETIKTPLFRDGELIGLMGIARDITEHKSAEEEAMEASKAKSLFLANMSHEIRTPMNAIIGMTELMLAEPLNRRQKSYISDINVSAYALLSIINDILDLSKIESGKMTLNPVNYDLRMLIANICSMFKLVARKKKLEFIFESEGEIPKCVYGDDLKIRQILTNICGNAVKFTNEGFVRLRVTALDDTMVFEVKDTGMGIREDDVPKLFEAFMQADVNKNRSIRGTGLGLTISKSFVEMMGGDIAVNSVYGEGTTFTVTIPMVVKDDEMIEQDTENCGAEHFSAPEARVLVVDDNELNIKVALGLLGLYDIKADSALSGLESIEKVKAEHYDVVFMDHMMPDMDGVEAAAEIRKLGGKYGELKIVALTANAIQGAKEMFLSNGFNGFLSKPMEKNELINTLREFLPKEKIVERQKDYVPDVVPDGFLYSLENIETAEINTETGMRYASGIERMYRETVELFCRKLPDECAKMERFLNKKELKSLNILVHAVKSSLYTIGAIGMSEMAAKLEEASGNGDIKYCEEQFPEFLEKLRGFSTELASAILELENYQKPKNKGDTKYLTNCIHEAINAAEEFDMDLAADRIESLLSLDYGDNICKLLKRAKSALADFDFEEAEEILKSILQ